MTDNFSKILQKLHIPKNKQYSLATVAVTDNMPLSVEYFSKHELASLTAYKHEKRRNEWLGGRQAAKQAAQKILHADIAYKDITIANREDGRPYLQLPTQLKNNYDISISHSSSLAIAMTAECACGVDIQKTEPTLTKVEKRFCTQKEVALFESITKLPKEEILTRLWCAKEAVKKAANICGTMPGFLELQLTDITAQNDIITATLAASKKLTSMPKNFQTQTCYNGSYGFASCLIPDLPNHIWEKRNA